MTKSKQALAGALDVPKHHHSTLISTHTQRHTKCWLSHGTLFCLPSLSLTTRIQSRKHSLTGDELWSVVCTLNILSFSCSPLELSSLVMMQRESDFGKDLFAGFHFRGFVTLMSRAKELQLSPVWPSWLGHKTRTWETGSQPVPLHAILLLSLWNSLLLKKKVCNPI